MAQQTKNDNENEEKEEKHDIPPQHKESKASKRLSLEGQLKAARLSMERYVNPTKLNKDKLIPKTILKNAKGIVFLTIIKAGFLFAANIGTGCVIVRNKSAKQNTITGWSPPSSIGVAGISFGFLAGGSKVDSILILNDDHAVKQFVGKGQLRIGGNIGLALGPVGRDADLSVGAGDGGVSAIYSYSHSQGLYGGLQLDGKVLSTRTKCNEKFYSMKSIKCADILAGEIPMPQNNDYDKIVSLLNAYCLDYAFPRSIEEKVDIEALLKKNDVNVENAVNTLHSVFNDIDTEIIRIVLMEQCWGNMDQAADILLTMSKKENKSNKNISKIIEENDTDITSKPATKEEITVIANAVKSNVENKAISQNVDKLTCYEAVNGSLISQNMTKYKIHIDDDDNDNDEKEELVNNMHYKIKVKIGDNRFCMIKVNKIEPHIEYILEDVDFIDNIIEHEQEEKQALLMPYSSNELVKLARTTTKKHLDLSDEDDDDYNPKNPVISSTIDTKYEKNNYNAPIVGNAQTTLPMLDNLIKSFE